MRANVDPSIDNLACGKLDWKYYIIRDAGALVAVNQSLIEIENYGLLA